jgi:hypothetical protein
VFDEVVIHTKTGQSIRGAVKRKRRPWVVLANATLLPDGSGEAVSLDGDVIIPHANLDFAQRTTKGAGS